MTCPDRLAQLRARRKELERDASRRPQEERRPFQERAAEIMRLEAREIADHGDTDK